MISQKEFNEILEKHLKIHEDGTIFIDDEKLAKQVQDYLKQTAKLTDIKPDSLINVSCKNGIFC